MTTPTNETASPAVDAFNGQPGKNVSLAARFKDPARWQKSLTEVGLWFLFGGLITTMLSTYSPGYPIVVGTSSIQPGIYWLDRQAFAFGREDFVSFPFQPSQPWLQTRYGDGREFTKMVKATAGDTVYADSQLRLQACHPDAVNQKPVCEDLGVAQTRDSIGRPLAPWVPANHQYTLRAGELWAWGPNPKSLDSRYYGPIRTEIVRGKATPLFLWGAKE